MTEKLYYTDPYLREFNASVVACEPFEGRWKVSLDRTAFYPEGGGQPADKGTIDGIDVLDVQKEDNEVFHFLAAEPGSGSVNCSVDWDHRFDYMQQHTGQHILSAVLKRLSGAGTVAVHQAEDYTSIEIDHNEFSPESIELIEDAANDLVCANHPVYSYLNGDIPISSFPIRRETKYTENVRLVQVGGESLENNEQDLSMAKEKLAGEFEPAAPGLIDLAACGGVHTTRTGEVGLIKFQRQEKVRGRLRLFWHIGKRAYRDYRMKSSLTDKIGEALSVPLTGIGSEFDRFVSSLGEEKKKNSDLLKEMAFLKAEEIRNSNLSGEKTFQFEETDPGYFKQIMISLSSFSDVSLCLLNIRGKEGQWVLISTVEGKVDFNVFRNELLPLLDGKGGGKAPQWQGKIGSTENLESFKERFADYLS